MPALSQQIRFCTLPKGPNGVRVAYATVGHGPALVLPAAWVGHLELGWHDPAVRAFLTALAAHRMVVRYDKPGCGLSDPWPTRQTLDTDLEALQGVVDHLRLDRLDLLGLSMGAPLSIAFAAHNPARVNQLILYGGYANGKHIASAEVAPALLDLVRAHWGLGSDVLADIFLADGSAETKRQFAQLQRGAASAQLAAELLAQCYETDVGPLLDLVEAPTLVLHRRDDRAIPYRLGRELAARIAGARLVTLAGRSHLPYVGDSAAVISAIVAFLGGSPGLPRPLLPAASGGVLTARQLEVVALVAEGLTNRQIAERLGIQERSAEGHLERIRQRLGVTSRAQIAVWWARAAHTGEVPRLR